MKPYAGQFAKGWTGGPGVCGAGSQEHFAKADRERLAAVIGEWRKGHDGYHPRVLEVGCGDLEWHGGALPLLYWGVDLHSRPSWYNVHNCDHCMIEGDAGRIELPTSDLAIARQVFIHLSNPVILAILDRLREAGVTWLLASTVPVGDNLDRQPWGTDYSIEGHDVDLAAEPFCLPYALPTHRGGAMRVFQL